MAAISSSLSYGRLGELGEHLAANEHDHAIADLQVVELVAREQQARAGRARDLGERREQQLLRGDVDAARRCDRDDQPRLARQRAGDRDLLLVAARQLIDWLAQPARDERKLFGERARREHARGRGEDSEPPARRRAMLIVMFSEMPSRPTKPSSQRSSGM